MAIRQALNADTAASLLIVHAIASHLVLADVETKRIPWLS